MIEHLGPETLPHKVVYLIEQYEDGDVPKRYFINVMTHFGYEVEFDEYDSIHKILEI